MLQSLPTHGFKWMKNLTKEKLFSILEKANHSMANPGSNKKGYVFEVDLDYPMIYGNDIMTILLHLRKLLLMVLKN